MNLNDTVTQVEQLLPRLIGESIRVVITLDSALANIRADPNQVEHVLMNLAVNARDAMPQGGTLYLATTNTVFDAAAVRAHPGAQPGPYVTVSVRDTGQGMDAAAAARVFEPFYTTKARGKGTGLGLATVYGIVKQAGGYIDLETASGRGSTFTVYFPAGRRGRRPDRVSAIGDGAGHRHRNGARRRRRRRGACVVPRGPHGPRLHGVDGVRRTLGARDLR